MWFLAFGGSGGNAGAVVSDDIFGRLLKLFDVDV